MYRPKTVHDDIASDTLDRVNHDCDASTTKLFERFGCCNINHGEPATESWVAVVPTDAYLFPSYDTQHFKHLLLVDRVDCFYAYCGGKLGHRKNIDDLDSILINEFTDHDTHNFKRHACSAVLEHL